MPAESQLRAVMLDWMMLGEANLLVGSPTTFSFFAARRTNIPHVTFAHNDEYDEIGREYCGPRQTLRQAMRYDANV